MKSFIIAVVCSLFILPVYAQESTRHTVDIFAIRKSESERLVGKSFPEFIATTPARVNCTNKNLNNKVVFVNFWFAGCLPCMYEMKALNDMYDKLKDKEDFQFLSLTFDPDTTIQKMIGKLKIPYNVFHLDKEECKRLNFGNGFPTSMVLDRNGVIRFFTTGGVLDEDYMADEMKRTVYPKIVELLNNR
jgi:thiol-disulfide isomerase/thioredoxin